MLTKKEKKLLRTIRKWLGKDYKPYSFWFVGDKTWEGGFFELPIVVGPNNFRDQYTLPGPGKFIVKNW